MTSPKSKANIETSFSRFSSDVWKLAEKKIDDPRRIAVLNALANLGHQQDDNNAFFESCGEYYLELRNDFIKKFNIKGLNTFKTFSTVTKKGGHKKHVKKGLSAAEIRNANRNNKASLEYKAIEEYLVNSKSAHFHKYTFCETKVIALMFIIKNSLVNEDLSFVYELYIGAKKVAKNLAQIQEHMVAKQNFNFEYVVSDLKHMISLLKSRYNLTYETILKDYPKLCLSTTYDTIFPSINIRPYDSQIELVSTIKEKAAKLIIYCSKIGSGKTSVSVSIAKYAESINKQLLFTCSIEPVRIQVCNMLYNMGIPFAIAVTNGKATKIINNYNCANSEPVAIVTDLHTTFLLLKEKNDYILFLDEPTVGADSVNHPVTNAVSKILKIAPPTTILSSATFPENEQIMPIIDYFNEHNENAIVKRITSKESYIGCSIYQFSENTTLIPFGNCNNKEELQNVINKLKSKPFIDRLLPAPLTFDLYRKVKQHIPNCIDLEHYFEQDIENLNQTNIQKIAIQLLENMLVLDDNLIKNICLNEIIPSDPNINSNIVTDKAHIYAGPCLYISEDPYIAGLNLYKELIAHHNVVITDIINNFNKNNAKFRSAQEQLEENLNKKVKKVVNESISCMKDDKSIRDKVKIKEVAKPEIGYKLQGKNAEKNSTLEQTKQPFIMFPQFMQVNSVKHMEKFNPVVLQTFNKTLFQLPIILEKLPTNLDIPDWVYYLLYCGIGIYSPQHALSNQLYNDIVLELASNKGLAFMISDENMSCGTDYPFSNILIEEKFAASHSMSTIFQLLGRAGRVGTSWTAKGHVGPALFERMMRYIVIGDEIDVEPINMVNSFLNSTDDTDKILHNGNLIDVEKNDIGVVLETKPPIIKETFESRTPVIKETLIPSANAWTRRKVDNFSSSSSSSSNNKWTRKSYN